MGLRRLALFAAALVAFAAAVHRQVVEDVSERAVEVLGFPPKYSDVLQGTLNDCFFLAAMAAIAHTRPQVLQRTITRAGGGDASGPAVYTVLFNLDGQPRKVSVDDQVPVLARRGSGGKDGLAAMPAPGSGALWPVILEKAYAKLFGSYSAIERGMPIEAFKVISQAPVHIKRESYWLLSSQRLKTLLAEAIDRGWPLVASSSDGAGEIGLQRIHAHTVLGVEKDAGGAVKAVQVYNLDDKNSYSGALKWRAAGGVVWLTFEEFSDYMDHVRYAKIEDDYTYVARTVPTGRAVLSLTTTSSKPFWVNLEWASARIFASRCGTKNAPSPSAKLEVLRDGAWRKAGAGRKAVNQVSWSVSSMRAEVTSGAGQYRVVVGTDFGNWNAVIRDVQVTVYSHKDADVELSVSEQGPGPRAARPEDDHVPVPPHASGLLGALFGRQEESGRSECTPSALREALARLGSLDNFDDLLAGEKDALFPEDQSSWGKESDGSRLRWMRALAIRALGRTRRP